jgi:hypothetical protein
MTYEPQVNDYVVWTKGVEGWVYFKDREYITIEYVVRPKDEVNFECCPIHRNERLLVICYNSQWKELQYIKSRQSIYEETENCLAIASEVPG